MKLKRVLSVCLAAATVATCSSVVSAADNGFAVRTPINLATGEEVTDTLTAGDVLAIPVDVFSSTGGIDSLTFDVNFADVLSIGYADTDLSDDQYANLESLGEIITEDDGTDVVVKNIYKAGRKKTYPGSWTINPNYVKDGVRCVRAVWANALTISTTDDPEAYIVCSVTKDVTADELNTALTGSSSEVISFSDIDGNMEDHALKADPAKLNATQGAFKVVLDADALPAGNWVQGLYAQVGSTKQDITACVHADGTTTYEFPVRVNSATGATNAIDVDIYATTTADEAGATTSTDKKIGSINLTMDGTVTSYTTVDGTIAK